MSKSRLASAFAAASALSLSAFGATPTAIRHQGRVRMSRHAERWGKGAVRLSDYSSLRKLMRAARRGKLPEERLGTIERAMQVVQTSRSHKYFNSSVRKRYGW